MKLNFSGMAILMDELTKSEMWAIYMMASGEEMTDQVSKTDLVRIICVLCKKLDWVENHNSFNYLPQEAKSTMEMKLNFRGMAILMDALSKSEMWAIYLMGLGQEIPDKVTKFDLIKIIHLLCKKLEVFWDVPANIYFNHLQLGNMSMICL